jgi:hypothetical protein
MIDKYEVIRRFFLLGILEYVVGRLDQLIGTIERSEKIIEQET